jgi:metal-sulfur cluster biosynthetic enzyme
MSATNGDRPGVVDQVRNAIIAVSDPELGVPLHQVATVRRVEADGSAMKIAIELRLVDRSMRERIAGDVTAALSGLPGVFAVKLQLSFAAD